MERKKKIFLSTTYLHLAHQICLCLHQQFHRPPPAGSTFVKTAQGVLKPPPMFTPMSQHAMPGPSMNAWFQQMQLQNQ
eukprot:1921828-Ditylum_brightwellii.AAC.1